MSKQKLSPKYYPIPGFNNRYALKFMADGTFESAVYSLMTKDGMGDPVFMNPTFTKNDPKDFTVRISKHAASYYYDCRCTYKFSELVKVATHSDQHAYRNAKKAAMAEYALAEGTYEDNEDMVEQETGFEFKPIDVEVAYGVKADKFWALAMIEPEDNTLTLIEGETFETQQAANDAADGLVIDNKCALVAVLELKRIVHIKKVGYIDY